MTYSPDVGYAPDPMRGCPTCQARAMSLPEDHDEGCEIAQLQARLKFWSDATSEAKRLLADERRELARIRSLLNLHPDTPDVAREVACWESERRSRATGEVARLTAHAKTLEDGVAHLSASESRLRARVEALEGALRAMINEFAGLGAWRAPSPFDPVESRRRRGQIIAAALRALSPEGDR